MKIELIKQKFDEIHGYKYKPFSWCCNALKESPCISFDEETYENEDYYEDDILPGIALFHIDKYGDWNDDLEFDNYTYYKINYCPFCGEPIEIGVVGEEDVNEQYQNLCKQRDELWKKYNRTDSKKKSEELYKQVHELDGRIEWFYRLLEYKDVKEDIC